MKNNTRCAALYDNTSVGRRPADVLRKEELHDAELPTFYAARNVDAVYDVDSRVGVLLAAAQHKDHVK